MKRNEIVIGFSVVVVAFVVILMCFVDVCHNERIECLESRLKPNGTGSICDEKPLTLPIVPIKSNQTNLKRFTVTAYCPCRRCCGRYDDGITASGHIINVGDRFVASPPEFAFGTIMNIPNYGTVKVLDRGGAIKGNRLDVFFATHQEALQWGVQNLDVEIIF